jgi:hypothetical protein
MFLFFLEEAIAAAPVAAPEKRTPHQRPSAARTEIQCRKEEQGLQRARRALNLTR